MTMDIKLSSAVQFLSTAQVAAATGLSPGCLARLRAQKKLNGPPFLKIGGSVRYPADRLRRWADASLIETSAGAVQ